MLKRTPALIILSVLFKLYKTGVPKLEYKDLAQAEKQDVLTPQAIGDLVRSIRARKFPDLTECGSAGSFFKNPVVTNDVFNKLQELHVDLPGYPNEGGIKVPLGFILDHMLNLRGYREGNVRLYEHQALVLVTDGTATSTEVSVFAESVASLVEKKTGLKIEREVQNFL
jgi:UDP-N-acetylmuramate dehydrogenase